MSDSVFLANALRISSADYQALVQGKTIVAIPWSFLSPGQSFTLYSRDGTTSLTQFWARCEFCKSIDDPKLLGSLSRLTAWTEEALQSSLQRRDFLFIAYLRVYKMSRFFEVVNVEGSEFLPLLEPSLISNFAPVLDDRYFEQCRQRLDKLSPPIHPELEKLQNSIAQLVDSNIPFANSFNQYIQSFLGWSSQPLLKQHEPNLSWISTISSLGDRSIEAETAKRNTYEAGTAFERIVHRSLDFLGFELDANVKGGAGGMDLYCTKPYPLVGECKSGQNIPGNTVYELDKLGSVHLGKKVFDTANKLIIGPGKPTPQLRISAQEFGISIIHPMTLQKLVELHAKYPGSVNLIELKKYLEPGQIDNRIDEYISKVKQEIEVRIHLVKVLKKYQEEKQLESVGIERLCGVYDGSEPPRSLNEKELHEILIELSSPLVGKIGRLKQDGKDWRTDRFYFLRDLVVD